jgi:pyruvate/2-oxoglutarate dehydrogenase complex dihydrolipoamide dehydrogenase (E3) component
VNWLRNALTDSAVKVRLGERADYETIRGLAPEVVILACGASLDLPEAIPGIADPLMPGFVVTADDVLAGKAPVGKRVMVVGARRVGLETADLLAGDGRQVIVCDSSQAPDALVPATVRPLLEERLKANRVEVLAEATVIRVRDMVVFVQQGGRIVQYDSLDTVVVACGWRRNDELAGRLTEHIETVAVVGDARSPRTAMAAIREAYETVAKL